RRRGPDRGPHLPPRVLLRARLRLVQLPAAPGSQGPPMRDAAGRFMTAILARQALVGLASFVLVSIFSPRLLGLSEDVAESVFSVASTLAVLAFSLTTAV